MEFFYADEIEVRNKIFKFNSIYGSIKGKLKSISKGQSDTKALSAGL
jgi:hypothetical protein